MIKGRLLLELLIHTHHSTNLLNGQSWLQNKSLMETLLLKKREKRTDIKEHSLDATEEWLLNFQRIYWTTPSFSSYFILSSKKLWLGLIKVFGWSQDKQMKPHFGSVMPVALISFIVIWHTFIEHMWMWILEFQLL